jgi:excisionase family DNA binding protein
LERTITIYHADDLINVREAAQQCGRNAETVRRWIWGGKLPAQKLGNQLFIKKQDLALFCRETATLKYSANPIEKEINDIIDKHQGEHMSGIDSKHKGDFLEEAMRFRKKLQARGYPGIDAAALVSKSREGRMRELRQGLR